MREMVKNGVIGDIVSVNAEYAQDWLLDQLSGKQDASLPTWRMDPEYSGIANCVGDIGTHIECAVAYVTGLKIKRLLATTNNFGFPLDFNANIIVEYDNGINGAYWCTQLAAGSDNGLKVRVFGKKGSLVWDQQHPDYVQFTPKGQATQTLSRGAGYITEEANSYSRIPPGHPEGLHLGFANSYKNIISSIIKLKSGQKPSGQDLDFPDVECGLSGVKFVHAVVESSKNNSSWVNL
jgi:predicted dehydrogenase